LRVSERESWRREKVLALARRFGSGLESRGVAVSAAASIVPVIVGEAGRALAVSQKLEDQGFLVAAIRPPTVPAGTARLRVTFSAGHEEAQVDALVNAVAGALGP
jgi:8-amino-7-oxononanoate synthase